MGHITLPQIRTKQNILEAKTSKQQWGNLTLKVHKKLINIISVFF